MIPFQNENGDGVHRGGEGDDTQADHHGNEAAVDGVKRGLQHLDGGIEDQAEGVGLQWRGGHLHIHGIEFAMLKNDGDDLMRKQCQTGRAGQREEEHEAQRLGQRGAEHRRHPFRGKA